MRAEPGAATAIFCPQYRISCRLANTVFPAAVQSSLLSDDAVCHVARSAQDQPGLEPQLLHRSVVLSPYLPHPVLQAPAVLAVPALPAATRLGIVPSLKVLANSLSPLPSWMSRLPPYLAMLPLPLLAALLQEMHLHRQVVDPVPENPATKLYRSRTNLLSRSTRLLCRLSPAKQEPAAPHQVVLGPHQLPDLTAAQVLEQALLPASRRPSAAAALQFALVKVLTQLLFDPVLHRMQDLVPHYELCLALPAAQLLSARLRAGPAHQVGGSVPEQCTHLPMSRSLPSCSTLTTEPSSHRSSCP